MSRKHFEAIAATIHTSRAWLSPQHADMLARDLAATLATTNGAFDRSRFLKACGVDA